MKLVVVIVIFASFMLVACSPAIKAFSDVDKDANITNYKSYTWLTEQDIEAKGINPIFYNELNDKRIKHAVDEQMKRRGFILSTDQAPLQLHYHIIVEDKTIVTSEPSGYTYTPFSNPKTKQQYPYKQGTLIIDLMDVTKKNMVWRGGATAAIEVEVSKKPEAAIQKGVEKIFKLFPYNFQGVRN